MTAAVLWGPSDLRVGPHPTPTPAPEWVVLDVEEAGICGTDLAVYDGRYHVTLPLVLGHEFSGRVAAVGSEVTTLKVGQRVAAQGGWPCGNCDQCRAGRTRTCRARALLGRTIDGCFAEKVAVFAGAVHPLPEGTTPRAAQAMTTLATVLHALARAGNVSGRHVAVIGAGHAGLMVLQLCRLRGAAEVVVLGTRAGRLAMASSLGADEVVNVRDYPLEEWLRAQGGPRFDVAFEASGTAAGLAEAVRVTGRGGTVVAYGILHGGLEGVPGHDIYAREITIVGSRGAGNHYAEALRLLSEGAVRADLLVTHVLPLTEADAGIAMMRQRQEEALRVVLRPHGGPH